MLHLVGCACVCFLLMVANSNGQSLFGSRAPTSNFSGTALGGSSLGGGLLGGQTLGGGTLGTLSNPAQTGFGQQATGQGGFVGRNPGTEFIGGNQRANQSGGGAANRQFGNRGAGQNRSNAGLNTKTGGSKSSRRVIRPRQRVAFSYPRHNDTNMSSSLKSQMRRIGSLDSGYRLAGVQVSVDAQGVATLSGYVDSFGSKKLAAILAQLEPGVRSVKNGLVVREPSPSS